MGLAERIVHAGGDENADIAVHRFTAGFGLYVVGEATRAELEAVFSLSAGDLAGVDALKAEYDALGTAVEKALFLQKIEWAGIFYENGTINAARYKQILGLGA